jgi:hypothetical protein
VTIVLSILRRVPAWVWLVVALVAWGGWNRHQALSLRKESAAQRAEIAAARANIEQAGKARKISDEHATKARAVGDRARTVGAGLRAVSQAASNPAAAAECRNHEAPASVIPDRAREDLVDLARRADETAEALSACQAWVRSVADVPRGTTQDSF